MQSTRSEGGDNKSFFHVEYMTVYISGYMNRECNQCLQVAFLVGDLYTLFYNAMRIPTLEIAFDILVQQERAWKNAGNSRANFMCSKTNGMNNHLKQT